MSRGIKVLSLFFIDEVAKYRDYEQEDGKGIYARMFEELYTELIQQPRFSTVKQFYKQSASEVHNGYFSCDKKGRVKDTKGDTADDYSTYNTIMKDKEWRFPLIVRSALYSHTPRSKKGGTTRTCSRYARSSKINDIHLPSENRQRFAPLCRPERRAH